MLQQRVKLSGFQGGVGLQALIILIVALERLE